MKKPLMRWESLGSASSDMKMYTPAPRGLVIPVYSPAGKRSRKIQAILGAGVLLLMLLFFLMHNVQVQTVADSFITGVIAEKEFRTISKRGTVASKEELNKLASTEGLVFAFYRIQRNENISSIAQKFGLSISTLLSLNSFDNAHTIFPGQRILLATQSGILYSIKKAEDLSDIAVRYGISLEETLKVNRLSSPVLTPGLTVFLPGASMTQKEMSEILGITFIRPVRRSRISSRFGMRRHPFGLGRILHAGIDFAAPIGTPIVAAREGRVVFAGTSGSYGLMVRIRHSNGYSTVYAHMSRIRVTEGAWVASGQRIGDVGNTGRSTGPHLHLELRKYGKPVNPIYNGLNL